MELKKGATLKMTLDNAYMEKCDENILWVDYKNLPKVVDIGSKIYVDDGLISLQVKEKGRFRQDFGSKARPSTGKLVYRVMLFDNNPFNQLYVLKNYP